MRNFSKYNHEWAIKKIQESQQPRAAGDPPLFEGDLIDQVYQSIAMIGYGVSFAEIQRSFPEHFNGDRVICMPNYENIVMWFGMSQEMAKAFVFLLSGKYIEPTPCQPLVYLIDGVYPNYPIAKKVYHYKKPHWLPVTFSTRDYKRARAWKASGPAGGGPA